MKKLIFTTFTLLAIPACSLVKSTPFDPKTCTEQIPKHIEGLEILGGSRTEQSIINDMQITFCNGQVLLQKMNERGNDVSPGTAVLKVVVEYTGEVVSSEIIETDILSTEFVAKVSDFVKDTDFSSWQRFDEDTEFIYPMVFYRWW